MILPPNDVRELTKGSESLPCTGFLAYNDSTWRDCSTPSSVDDVHSEAWINQFAILAAPILTGLIL